MLKDFFKKTFFFQIQEVRNGGLGPRQNEQIRISQFFGTLDIAEIYARLML